MRFLFQIPVSAEGRNYLPSGSSSFAYKNSSFCFSPDSLHLGKLKFKSSNFETYSIRPTYLLLIIIILRLLSAGPRQNVSYRTGCNYNTFDNDEFRLRSSNLIKSPRQEQQKEMVGPKRFKIREKTTLKTI